MTKQFIPFDINYYNSLDSGGKVAYKNKVRKSGNGRYSTQPPQSTNQTFQQSTYTYNQHKWN